MYGKQGEGLTWHDVRCRGTLPQRHEMLRLMTDAARISADRRRELAYAVLLYRVLARGESIPQDLTTSPWQLLEPTLRDMLSAGLLQRGEGAFLEVTDDARSRWRGLSSLLEGVQLLDVLAYVNLHVTLDEHVSDDSEDVFDDVSDPRYTRPRSADEAETWGTEDMRLAVLTYLSEQHASSVEGKAHGAHEVDPHRVALLLQLVDGRFRDDGAWFDLAHGGPSRELDERVESAYRYDDVSDDAREIDDVVRHIFEASVIERRKRAGEAPACPTCGDVVEATSLWCPPCEASFLTALASPLL